MGSFGLAAETAVPLIKEFLQHENSTVREVAAQSVKQITGEEVKLPERNENSNEQTSLGGPVYDGKNFDQWITLLKTDKSAHRRAEGIKALTVLHTKQNAALAVATILEIYDEHKEFGIDKGEPKVRSIAESALAKMDRKLVEQTLLERLKSKDPSQRLRAANLLRSYPCLKKPGLKY